MAKISKVFMKIFRGNLQRNADELYQNIRKFQQHCPKQQFS